MKKAGEVLTQAIANWGIRKKFEEHSILYHWREIVGEEIYSHARAASLNRGVLLVVVGNSVWCHHLAISKEDIINKINTFAGEKYVTDIRFKAGNLKDYQNYENDMADFGLARKIRFAKLSAQETEALAAKASCIQNQALRQKVLRVLKKDLALRKTRLAENWKPCQNCSVLCPPEDSLCSACSLEAKRSRLDKLRTILTEVPWLMYDEIQTFVPCRKGEYIICKQELQEHFAQQVQSAPDNRVALISYIMLKQGLKPEQITEDIVEYTIHSLRRKKYVFTPGG